jgi:outer membrane receptor for ferrienterochelin and colicins
MAQVCFESDDKKQALSQVTNEYGKVSFMIENPGTIAISCIGYKTLIARLKSAPLVEFTLNKSIIEVGEVVVTGQVNPQTTDKSIYKVNVISSQQIRDKAANSLADVFTGSISTSPVNNGILGKSIIMLGLSGENIKILVDGVPVIGRQDGNLDLEQVNLSNIDHIETIEGPMSVIYGSNALGGVVNLISRQKTKACCWAM